MWLEVKKHTFKYPLGKKKKMEFGKCLILKANKNTTY